MPLKKSNRKQYTPQFKLKLAIEVIKKDSLSEVARQYGIGANVLSHWKQQLLEHGHQVFETTPNQAIELQNKQIAKLEQLVGKKEIELNLLKNFSDFYASQNSP